MVLTDRSPARRQRGERARWRARWWELLPEAGLAVGLAAFLLDEPDAATSALKSGRALFLMVAVGVAWVVARVVLGRLAPWPLVRLAAFGAAALVILAVVVLPAYDQDTVVEAFPGAGRAAPAAPASAEAAPVASAASPATTVAPAQPTRLRVGRFRGVDHRASGTVAIYRQPDGRYVVGLEQVDIQPGPDYDLYVVPGAGREDRDDGVRLDDVRANRGTQYYEVPAGVDLSKGPWTVLVWCQTFGVPVATATPA
jgi:hypothetical protein